MKQHAYINGTRRRDLEKLTPAMWQMLFDIRDCTNSLHGRSAYGGATWPTCGLWRRGFMTGNELTDAGREACGVEWRESAESHSA
jgi:hypothetical protein